MELEEIIGIKQRKIDRVNKVGERTGETYWESEIYILKYLEELKSLRVEHEKNSKELEVYKKAFELSCKAVDECGEVNYCDDYYMNKPCKKGNTFEKFDSHKCVECCMEHFLLQARKDVGNDT